MSGFNSIDTAHRLEERGFSRDQAEVLAPLFSDFWGSIVTQEVLREELTAGQQVMGREFAGVRQESATLRQDIIATEATLRTVIADTARDLEHRLTIRLGRMVAYAGGTVIAFMSVFVAASTLVIHFWT